MSEIAKIKLELSDWLYNAGIVGVCKIFDKNDDYYEKHQNYIVFDESLLENFEEKYFDYFISKYEKFTSWYKIVSIEDKIVNFSKDIVDEKYIDKFNKQIDYVKKKLTSASYESAYEVIENKEIDLLKEEEKLKKIEKTKKQSIENVIPIIKDQNELLQEIIEYLKKEEVKKYILKYELIGYYDQKKKTFSYYGVLDKFWNVNLINKESYYKRFVSPTLEYIKLEKNKEKYFCIQCSNKIDKNNSLNMTWIHCIGADANKKSSHFWEMESDIQICPACALVYSCIPAGFTTIRDKGIFINENSDINTLIKVNNTVIDNNTNFQELEQKSYFAIVDNITQSQFERTDKQIQNIQIVNLNWDQQGRPYTFNIMSKNKLKIIFDNRKNLRKLVNISIKVGEKNKKPIYINLYSEVIKRLYDNKNLFDLISGLFYLKLSDKFKGLSYLKNIIKINNSFLGGIMGQKIYYKKIDEIQQLGFNLRKEYEIKKADNKINGITYRLLNALKTKNSNRFMDTLLNAYMYIRRPIPTEFIEGLEDEAKLQTIGYAFLLGLQGDNFKLEDNEKEGVVNNE